MYTQRKLQEELTAFYALYEEELQTWIASYDRHIYCKKGCGTCCDMSVGLYLSEAVVLANSLSESAYARVAAHAERVVEYARTTADYLGEYRYAGLGPCPFLDTDSGACSIHPRRPANCRHVFSNMPPEYCSKETIRELEQDSAKFAEFLRQLDPRVNDDELPYISPLQDIFHEKYEVYLMLLSAKYSNVIVLGEMSWLIMLAREHRLWDMAAEPDTTPSVFLERLRSTGWYHENLLTECQAIVPEFKEESLKLDFTVL